jgi:hypothetical protein
MGRAGGLARSGPAGYPARAPVWSRYGLVAVESLKIHRDREADSRPTS